MADGRDLAVMGGLLAGFMNGDPFMDPKKTVLVARSRLGMVRIQAALGSDSYEWSDPASGRMIPVRTIESIRFDGRPAGADATYCGFSSRDDTLIIWDGSRQELARFVLSEFNLLHQTQRQPQRRP